MYESLLDLKNIPLHRVSDMKNFPPDIDGYFLMSAKELLNVCAQIYRQKIDSQIVKNSSGLTSHTKSCGLTLA